MRDAMCADDHDVAGPLLRRPQRRRLGQHATRGESWRQIVADLPDVMVVRAAAV